MKENQRGIKMICEWYNKMVEIDYNVFECGTESHITSHYESVSLCDFVGTLCGFIMMLILIYWWICPIIWVYHKYFGWTENISFECKKRE